jgi:hypothetical protein
MVCAPENHSLPGTAALAASEQALEQTIGLLPDLRHGAIAARGFELIPSLQPVFVIIETEHRSIGL